MTILKIYKITFLNGEIKTFYTTNKESIEKMVTEIEAMPNNVINWQEETFIKCLRCEQLVSQQEIRLFRYKNSMYDISAYCEKCYMNNLNCFSKLNELKEKGRAEDEE